MPISLLSGIDGQIPFESGAQCPNALNTSASRYAGIVPRGRTKARGGMVVHAVLTDAMCGRHAVAPSAMSMRPTGRPPPACRSNCFS
jgi:hypothetical protein